MQKPLSKKRLRRIIKEWKWNVYAGIFDNETCALFDLCKYIEEEHGIGLKGLPGAIKEINELYGIVKETPKEHSEKPVQLELDMWL